MSLVHLESCFHACLGKIYIMYEWLELMWGQICAQNIMFSSNNYGLFRKLSTQQRYILISTFLRNKLT